jgi:hypothetical protein
MKKTIKIAVTIDETGNFGAIPINDGQDVKDSFDFSCGGLEGACLREYLVEVEVDVPTPEVIMAQATAQPV